MNSRQIAEPLHQYWEDWQVNRSDHAGSSLIEAYMPLVDYHVQRVRIHLPRSVREEELRSHGLIGLYDALEKFDTSRDLKFDTYASFRIRGAIIDGLRQEDWLPRSVREKAKKIDQAADRLEQQLGRAATADEISRETGYETSDITKTLNDSFISHFLSIDEKAGDDDSDDSFVQTLADKTAKTPDEALAHKGLLQELVQAVGKLNEKEQTVVSLFYAEELTLTEIGNIMNLSTSRISQIHSKCMKKLQQFLTDENN
ncbi:FliA/WhiG family RNA polymerase sigma factor [Bacillus daqingensis]|uniref:FliA/WhiG family RNA polymerase sigma factor n=1 Tax=Bacillus daqingensis TaxID=872396 RepID=A0ABV9NUA2_9BACI